MASVPNMRPAPVLATAGAAPAPEGAGATDFTRILSQVPGEAIIAGPGVPGGQPTVDVAPVDPALEEGSTPQEGKEEATGEEGIDVNAPIVIAQQIADLVPIALAQGGQPAAVTIPVPDGSASAEPTVATTTATVAMARATLPGSVAPTNLPAQTPAAALPAANDPAVSVQGSDAARSDPRTAAPFVTTPPPAATPKKAHAKGEPAVASKSPGPQPSTILPPPPPGARAAGLDAPVPPLPVAKPQPDAAAIVAGTEAGPLDVARSTAPRRTVEILRAPPERVAEAPQPAMAQGAAFASVAEGEGKRPAPAKAAAVRVAAEVQAQPQPVATEAAATALAPQTPFAAIQPAATSLAAAPLSAPGQAATTAPGQELGIERELDLAHEGEWLDRLARDIVRAGANDGSMRFRLNPQTLGHLQVELAQGDHGTSIRLSVETEAARAILVDAQPRLLAEARAQGVRIAESEVDLAGSGHQPGSDPRRQAEGPQTPFIRTARGGGSAAADAVADPAPPRSDRYA